MIRQVVLKEIPVTWNLSLKRANNHMYTTLVDLQKVLKPIKEADEVERKFSDQKKRIGGNKSRQYQDRGQGNYQSSNKGQTSGDKPYRKMGHNHKGKYFPDNRFGTNYQGNENMRTIIDLDTQAKDERLRMKTIILVT